MRLLAAHLLLPNSGFVVEVLLYVVIVALLTVWPLVEQARARRWRWFAATVALGPLAGAAWFAVGRRRRSIIPG
jgi:DMSO/TMAO reductase YedYZ heme-binding membrane subunit